MPKLRSFTPKNAAQKALAAALDRHSIVFAIGMAGTGKTHAAVALGLELCKSKWAQSLVICRPARGSGRSTGLLPGTLEEKMAPFFAPIHEVLEKLERGVPGYVKAVTFEYMRGCTFEDAVVIVDEAQNATLDELEMVLTRLGQGSKMILCGDPAQTDLVYEDEPTGLPIVLKLLAGDTEFPVVRFTETDNLRHPLVAKLSKIFHRYHTHSHQEEPADV